MPGKVSGKMHNFHDFLERGRYYSQYVLYTFHKKVVFNKLGIAQEDDDINIFLETY